MKVKGTYFQNSADQPLVYGEVETINPPRRKLRGLEEKQGIIAESAFVGFCGTDFELMHMGQRGQLNAKFPAGQKRLINGHEGLVWVPSENRFAIVLIRGGNSYDPTRYTEEESYFEYGCDGADGLFSDMNYYHPDMLLKIPDGYVKDGKLPLSLCKKLVFADPYACMIFQRERMEDLGEAHNFRVKMAQYHCSESEAREIARRETFQRVCIFGLGTTGMFIGDLIRQRYPDAKIVFVARSDEDSPKVSFALKQARADYVKSNFATNEELAAAIEERLGGRATVFIGCSGANIEHEIAFKYELYMRIVLISAVLKAQVRVVPRVARLGHFLKRVVPLAEQVEVPCPVERVYIAIAPAQVFAKSAAAARAEAAVAALVNLVVDLPADNGFLIRKLARHFIHYAQAVAHVVGVVGAAVPAPAVRGLVAVRVFAEYVRIHARQPARRRGGGRAHYYRNASGLELVDHLVEERKVELARLWLHPVPRKFAYAHDLQTQLNHLGHVNVNLIIVPVLGIVRRAQIRRLGHLKMLHMYNLLMLMFAHGLNLILV